MYLWYNVRVDANRVLKTQNTSQAPLNSFRRVFQCFIRRRSSIHILIELCYAFIQPYPDKERTELSLIIQKHRTVMFHSFTI